MDSRLRGNDGRKNAIRSNNLEMIQSSANVKPDQRRAGIRRTAWIAGAVALTFFVLFFVVQFAQH